MYSWQVQENGEWNIIAMIIMGELSPLVTTRLTTFEAMKPYAELHQVGTKLPVRGVYYDDPTVLETLP